MNMEPNPPLVWPLSDNRPPWTGFGNAAQWFAATSALDDSGVAAVEEWLNTSGAKSAQLIVLVYGACATTHLVLTRLLKIVAASNAKLECFLLATGHYHTDANGTAVLMQTPGRRFRQLWTGNTSNFDMIAAPDGRLNVFMDVEDALAGRWMHWFARLLERSAPLTALTADIPALLPPQGNEEGFRIWESYQGMCAELGMPPEPKTEEEQVAAEERIEEKTKELCAKMNVAAPDPIAERVLELYKQGVLVTIDKSGVVPPLHIPVKAKWLGVESERKFGKGRRKVDFKLQLFEPDAAKRIDAFRKSLPQLLDWYSFRLADDHRWVPNAALPLIQKEMTRIDQQAKAYVQELIGKGASEYATSRRKEMQTSVTEMCQEFHPGREVGPDVMDDIVREAERRLGEALRDRFIPRISETAVSFIPPADSSGTAHSDAWAQARTMLGSIAEYFRDAVTNNFFFQGYKLNQGELLKAMDVAGEWIATNPWHPDTKDRAGLEAEYLDKILTGKDPDREKCKLILDLIDGKWTPPEAVQSSLSDVGAG
jgi:hypothetical protein